MGLDRQGKQCQQYSYTRRDGIHTHGQQSLYTMDRTGKRMQRSVTHDKELVIKKKLGYLSSNF